MSENDPVRSITFAVPSSFLARIDAHVDAMKKKVIGVQVSRTDALKNLIERGLSDASRSR